MTKPPYEAPAILSTVPAYVVAGLGYLHNGRSCYALFISSDTDPMLLIASMAASFTLYALQAERVSLNIHTLTIKMRDTQRTIGIGKQLRGEADRAWLAELAIPGKALLELRVSAIREAP